MKTLKMLLAFLLALAMVFAFAACDKNDDGDNSIETTLPQTEPPTEPAPTDPEVCGEWAMNWDLSEMMNGMLAMSLGAEMEMPTAPVYFVFGMEFDTDFETTMTLELDEESFDAYIDELCDSMIEYLRDMVEAQGATQADLEAELGMSLDEYVYSSMEALTGSAADAFDVADLEGYFRVDGNKIYFAEDKDDLEDPEDYMVYSIDGDKLIFEELVGDNITNALQEMKDFGLELPWEFERQ